MKRITLKCISYFLALIIIFSSAFINISMLVSAESDNLVINGDFEKGTENWGSEHMGTGDMAANRVISDTVGSDTYSANVHSGTKSATVPSGYNHFIYTKINCIANTDYILEFYTINASGVSVAVSPNMDVQNAKSFRSGNVPEGTLINESITVSDTWSKTRVTFNSGESTSMYIAFYNRYDGAGTIRIDDVSLKIDEYAGQIIKNGGFESSTDWWTADSEGFTVEQQESNNVLHVYDGYYNTAYQEIAVAENTDYILKFRYKGQLCEEYSHWSISHSNSSFENNYILSKGILSSADDWSDFSVVFNSGENEILYFTLRTVLGCDYYIDDVQILETTDSAAVFETVQAPAFIAQQTSTRYICSQENNIITDFSFEEGNGNWNTSTFIKGILEVISYSSAVSGSKVLKLSPTGVSSGTYNFFFADVNPNTDYAFSVWVKGEAWSSDNKNDMTFGVTDAETGLFLASNAGTNDDRRYTDTLQLCPPSWDGEWHLVGLTFNSGEAQNVGITVYSESSTAYFDDMYLAELSSAQKYVSSATAITGAAVTETEPTVITCETDKNLVENNDFSDSSSDFWQTGQAYGENVSVIDSGSDFGNSLYFVSSKAPEHKYYIKYVDVSPNTYYTFSAKYSVIENGNGAFGLIDGSEYLPEDIARFDFSSDELYNWQTAAVTFNSGGHTRIGIFVYDGGGEALLDNFYLFEQSRSATGIINGDFENGTTGWYWSYGVTTEQVYEGNNSLIVNDGTGGYKNAFRCVEVTPNTDYELNFWYYAPSGEGWRTALYINGAQDDVDRANPKDYFLEADYTLATFKYEKCDTNVWKQATIAVNSGDYSVLVLDFSTHKKALYIDEVSLEIVENLGSVSEITSLTPDTPKVLSYTESSIELVADNSLEYRINDGAWQSSPVFEGLKINTEYKIYARAAESSVKNASEASSPLLFTIPASHGDANADESVNGTDLVVLRKLLLGISEEHNPDGCDSNGDTVVNIKDLVSLKKRTAGIKVKLAEKVSLKERENAENGVINLPVYNEYERLGFSNEYEYLLARDGFIYGMDYDWFVTNGNSGFHLSGNHILNQKSAFAPELIYSELYNMKAMGYNTTSVWLLNNGQGMLFDENGTVIGLDPEFIENLRSFLKMCREIGIDCVPSILPHGIADNYGNGSDTESATEIWNKYFRFYYNAEARKAYIDNAIAPLCELLSEFTDIIPICNLTVENTNYTDDYSMGYFGSVTGTTWENLSVLINDMSSTVKAYMPNMLTSTENMGDSFLQFRCNELEVDLIGQNRYAGGSVKDPATEYLTKPTYLGEFNTGSMTDESISTDSVRLNFYPNALENGYKGAFYFSYSTGGDIFSPFAGLQTEPETLHPFAVEMSYQVRNYILTHKNEAEEINRPVLLYNRGTGEICWFGGRSAESFVIESSADGGESWNTVATISAQEVILSNGLCRFVDSGFTENMSLCYRVTARALSGVSYTSAVNNVALYDPNANLLSDGGFEEESGVWTYQNGGAGSVSSDNSYSGEKCLLVDKSNGIGTISYGKTYQDVVLEPNTAYILNFAVNITRGSSVSVRAFDVENNKYLGTYWIGSTDGEWTESGLKFATNSKTNIRIIIDNGSSTNTYALFDDISLKKLK